MKNKKLFYVVLAILMVAIVLFLLFPVKHSRPDKKAYTSHIAAFTSGMISNQSTIRVMLNGESEQARPGEELEVSAFDFNPNIKGKAYWLDAQTLEFRPAAGLPSGQEYKARLRLNRIMNVPKKLKTFEFSFQTLQQSYEVTFKGLEAYDPLDLTWQQLMGELRTSDYAEANQVKNMLTAVQQGKELSVTWQHGPEGKIHQFRVDSVLRKESAARVELSWDGSSIGADRDHKEPFRVPSLSEFEVLHLGVSHYPEQSISVVFSDPIDQEQELEGLIHLKSGTPVSYLVSGNEVKVFPEQKIKEKDELVVEPSVSNTLGYKLDETWSSRVDFRSIKPAVEFLGDGNILPGSKQLTIPFRAVNLSGVNVRIIKIFEDNVPQFFQVNHLGGDDELKRVGRIVYHDDLKLTSEKPIDYGEWNTFSLDLSDMIKPDPGAIYRVQLNFDRSQSLYPCPDDAAQESRPEQVVSRGKENESDLHYWHYRGYNYYDYDDDYQWSERDDPCKKSYYMRYNRAVARNVLASDLGMIAKRGNDGVLFLAVANLRTTRPLASAKLEVYNFQHQLIGSRETNSDGMAKVETDSKPFLVIAQKGKQYGYLRVDEGASLSLSKFNVAGRETQDGLKGFIYGERDVWRPGDSLFLSFMVHDEADRLPDEHPVVMEMINSRGQMVDRLVKTSGVNGVYGFRTATAADAPTGRWKARVKVGGAVFEKDLRIETIKPNRLKQDLAFEDDRFSSSDQQPVGRLNVAWLHGAPASELKADVKMQLVSAGTSFDDYPGYRFEDPSRSFTSEEQTLFEGRLDEQGQASVRANLETGEQAPGMLKAAFSLRAFEESGNFSVSRQTIPYSPYPTYVGLKIPEGSGWQGALSYDEEYTLPVVTVNEDGQPISRDNLEVQIYKIRWRWWWERNETDNLSRYVGSSSRYLLHKGSLSTRQGEGQFRFRIGEKFWGRVLIRVVDKMSGHSAGGIAYVSYPGWNQQQVPGGAQMLSFSTDKDVYQAGEQVQVKIPSSEGGRVLVSLENGSGILKTFWVKTSSEFTHFRFEATPRMAPNVYIHLSLLQPHDQTKNDLPIRLYGVQPVRVEHQATHLNPVIDMADELRPLEEVEISVREEDGHAMSYTLAVVDEGLLDITGFQTPRPWDHFYARDALGVKTWDLYDYVLGAHSGELAGLYEIGGGLESDEAGGRQARRFEPVVRYFGPFHLPARKSQSHGFTMPNYIGSVKTMVVAAHEGSFGSAERVTPVRKPLMVQATLPRVAGPGERITLPVTVFAMDDHIRSVKVNVETNQMLRPVNSSEQTVEFKEKGDQVVNFQYEVAERLGVAEVQVTALSGSERSTSNIELQVRSPNPRITRVVDTSLKDGASLTQRLKPVGMKGTNQAILEVSRVVPMNLEERLDWLIRYPHGCVEQVTSSVFPQLFLDQLINLSEDQKNEIQENVREGIQKLVSFQLPDGGFSYWPGREDVSHWGSSYAGHFLLEAREKGYDIPAGMIDRWVAYQRKAARNWSDDHYYDTYRSSDLTQAYRLYGLALAGSPEKGAMNRLRRSDRIKLQARWRLAAAYILTGKDQVAWEMMDDLSTDVEPYHQLAHTYGSHIRDKAMILETLILSGDDKRAAHLMRHLAEQLGSGRWFSTQTTAYALLAISKYLGSHDPGAPLKYAYAFGDGNWKEMVTQKPLSQVQLPLEQYNGLDLQIRNNGENRLFVRIIMDGIPAAGQVEDEEHNMDMEVEYTDMQGRPLDVSRLEQGTDFMARVTLRNRDIQDYEEMALTQIFPSGWEIHNERLGEYDQTGDGYDRPEYQDIRDDRVYSYFDLKQGQKKTFVVRLNATYQGRFYLPSVYCEAMYDHSIRARKGGQWVEVVRPGSE